MSPVYTLYKKSKAIQQHTNCLQSDKRTISVGDEVCSKLFKGAFLQELAAGALSANDGSGKEVNENTASFAEALYEVYAIAFSVVKEVEQNIRFKQGTISQKPLLQAICNGLAC